MHLCTLHNSTATPHRPPPDTCGEPRDQVWRAFLEWPAWPTMVLAEACLAAGCGGVNGKEVGMMSVCTISNGLAPPPLTGAKATERPPALHVRFGGKL